MQELISLAEARDKGLPRYFTGKPCKRQHIAERLTSTRACTSCTREANATRRDADPERASRYGRQWRKDNPRKVREANLARYGLTLEDYERMVVAQNNRCAVCDQALVGQKICVDHCHETGRVRGLLHNRCNTAIGLLNDDPVLLLRAAAYLRGA